MFSMTVAILKYAGIFLEKVTRSDGSMGALLTFSL